MNHLIDRMITRVQRPLSPVEPLLTQPYVSRASVSANDEINPTAVVEPRREDRSYLVVDSSDVSVRRIQRTQDAPDAQPFHQSTQQRPINVSRGNHFSDSLIPEVPAPTLAPNKEPSPSSPSQLYERDNPRTQLGRPTQTPSKYIPKIPEKEPKLPSIRLTTSSRKDELTRRTERRVDESNIQNRLPHTTEVNISIGHIEVRAIQRTEPIRRSVPPSHVTLDDYLRRRPEASR
jgi:FtsZ-interacting cell division protein ZipA